MSCQTLSQMAQDKEKYQLEDCSITEDVSFVNNKKRCRSKNNNTMEQKAVPIVLPGGVEVDDKTCSYCLKSFKNYASRANHLRLIHNVTRTNGFIKCHECNTEFFMLNKLRLHLEQIHGLTMTQESHTFPNMDAFKVWKLNIERKEGVSFRSQTFVKTKQQCIRYHYICNRTGKYNPQRHGPKNRSYYQSIKMGSYCTAGIICLKSEDEVQVKYWPQHYGHWTDISSELPLDKDKSISEGENITGGDSFNDLLKDVRSDIVSQLLQPSVTRKRDQQLLTETFESDKYYSGLSDSESVDHWVRLCLQMEDSPVLCYRQEELADGKEEEFLLIIMTEFQKQLLMSSEKKVICVDCLHRQKGRRFYLSYISIVDECDVAFPVAFCISNKVNEDVIRQFLMSFKKATGPLSFIYFMSSEKFYFDAWKDIMNDTSKWLWSMWSMENFVKAKLKSLFKSSDFEKKVEIYNTTRTLIQCHSQTIFESIFKKYLDSLLDDHHPAVKKFGDIISNKYSPYVERWAYCYRTDMKTSTNFQLEALHRTLRFCCQEGTKTRLDKFIFALMKFVKWKMFHRLTNILDDEKIEMVRETINICHKAGLDIAPNHISSLSNKIWLVKSEDEEENVYVVRDFDSCKEHCMMRCPECDICVHMYSCSCIPSMINANLCQHIHAVVWKFLTPQHFSPMPSPTLDDNADSDSNDPSTAQKNCPEILESILNLTREINNSVRKNKSKFSEGVLTLVKSKLCEAKKCIDVCTEKKATLNAEEIIQKVSFLPHSDLPPSQNSILQPFVTQALQPNVKSDSSQTLVLNQTVLPQDKSLSQQYLIYVPFNKLNRKETVKVYKLPSGKI